MFIHPCSSIFVGFPNNDLIGICFIYDNKRTVSNFSACFSSINSKARLNKSLGFSRGILKVRLFAPFTTNGALTRTTFGLPISTSPLLSLIYAPLQVISISSFAAMVTFPALLVTSHPQCIQLQLVILCLHFHFTRLACILMPLLCANS